MNRHLLFKELFFKLPVVFLTTGVLYMSGRPDTCLQLSSMPTVSIVQKPVRFAYLAQGSSAWCVQFKRAFKEPADPCPTGYVLP
jgi:hypothetical protein